MILDIFDPKLGVRKEGWHPKVKLLDRLEFIGQKKILENWTDGFQDRDGKIIKAVSYTHLDVYKRQVKGHEGCKDQG